jgi:hypothetical protein
MLVALRRAQEDADALYELAADSQPQLAVAIAHRLSSFIQGMKVTIEASTAS